MRRGRRKLRAQKQRGISERQACTQFTVYISLHTSDVKAEIIANPSYLPGASVGDVLSIRPVGVSQPIFLQIDRLVDDPKSKVQLSIVSTLGDMFSLQNRDQVDFKFVEKDTVILDYIELTFQGQYMSRGDIWRFKEALDVRCVYQSQQVSVNGQTADLSELVRGGKSVVSGVVGKLTKWVMRSKSARLTWMIQLSEEMWDICNDGELHFEKVVNGLIRVIFSGWKNLQTNHRLSIVLFSRTFYYDGNEGELDYQGRRYKDFYKLIVDSQPIRKDWKHLSMLLKQEINDYGKRVGWAEGKCGPSYASEGNILEALNMSLNVFDRHYIDRDTKRTGLGIVLFTAGNGVMFVDPKLAQLTKQRLMDNGVGCDVVSVASPPFHYSPLFIHKPTEIDSAPRYDLPRDWFIMSFYDYRFVDRQGEDPTVSIGSLSRRLLELRQLDPPFYPLSWCSMFPNDEDWFQMSQTGIKISYDPETCPSFIGLDQLTSHIHDTHVFDEAPYTTGNGIPRSESFMSDIIRSRHSDDEFNSPNHGSSFNNSGDDLMTNFEIDSRVGRSLSASSNPLQQSRSVLIKGGVDIDNIITWSVGSFSPPSLANASSFSSFNNLKAAYLQKNTKDRAKVKSARLQKRRNPNFKDPLSDADEDQVYSQDLVVAEADGESDADSKLSELSEYRSSPAQPQSMVNLAQRYREVIEPRNSRVSTMFAQPSRPKKSSRDHPAPHVNPFNPDLKPSNPSSNRRRWLHLLPTKLDNSHQDTHDQLNMKSLTTPAILPLTCDYFPSFAERTTEYLNYVHTMSSMVTDVEIKARTLSLVNELVTQRLNQDFQLADTEIRTGMHQLSDNIQTFRMCIADECHIIECDLQSGNIDIQRYVRRGRERQTAETIFDEFSYKYSLWSEAMNQYCEREITLGSHHHDFNWNYFDRLLGGAESDTLSGAPYALKYRRLRYLLRVIPEEAFESPSLRFSEFFGEVVNRDLATLGICVAKDDATLDTLESRSLKISLPSSFSGRDEWLQLVYESVFDEQSYYSIEVQWLAASGHRVEEFTRLLSQAAFGKHISLIRVPSDQSVSTANPFHMPLIISFDSELHFAPIQEYLSSRGFVRDHRIERIHFIHDSGMALLYMEDCRIIWVNNYLLSAITLRSQSLEEFVALQKFIMSLA